MSIKYALVLRKNTRTNIKSIYGAVVNGSVDTDQVARRIAASTTVTYPDVLAVVKALEEEIQEHLLDGDAVKLSLLGTFYPTIETKGCEETSAWNTNLIKKVRVRFRPNTKLVTEITKRAQFEQVVTKMAANKQKRLRDEAIDRAAQESRQEAQEP